MSDKDDHQITGKAKVWHSYLPDIVPRVDIFGRWGRRLLQMKITHPHDRIASLEGPLTQEISKTIKEYLLNACLLFRYRIEFVFKAASSFIE